jgi:hypothetical protein
MGEAKRRQIQGLPPKQAKQSKPTKPADRVAPWLPLNRDQADRFVAITTKAAWIGIAGLVIFWITVRFVGPSAGWWTLADS